jgi:two-component system cell cycle sensor histidine kinase/response regulator CckA
MEGSAERRPVEGGEVADSGTASTAPMPSIARGYWFAVVTAAMIAAALTSLAGLQPNDEAWVAFFVLAPCAALAQLFTVRTGRSHGFHTAVVFIVAGALLLPPELVALMGVVQHVPEWLKERYSWYVQSFNICNYTLNALAAWGTARLIMTAPGISGDIEFAVAGVAASVAFVLLNHLLLAPMLRLARGQSFRESGLFSAQSLFTDLVLAGLGVAFAYLWRANPWLTPALVAPLILSHHSYSLLALLRTSEERFRAMFENAATGMVITDLQGRIVASNSALEEMLGYDAEELRGFTLPDLSHPDDREQHTLSFDEMLAGANDHFRLENRYVAKSWRVVWGNVAVSLIRDAGRRPQFVIAMVEDITERKLAAEAVRDSEQRYRELFENASDMIATLDLDLNFTSVNSAFEQVLDYSRDELLGTNVAAILPPESIALVRHQLHRKLSGEAERTTYEIEYLAKDGSPVLLEVSARLIHERGAPVAIQVFARDLSERKRLEEQLRQAQKMEAVGRLAGGVAHDFNNLLTAITGYTEFALRGLDTGDGVERKDVEEIGKAAERATTLTRQLLAFSRKQILQPKVLNLNGVVADMEKMLGRLIGEDIQIVTNLAPTVGRVEADPGQLEQVIVNLVVNARDAMPDGGTLTIETANVDVEQHSVADRGPVPTGSYVTVTVRDTGTGMDERTKARLFEPFFTTKELGKGTGLGLATVYGIVKQSGGYITVASEEGTGATFTIYLQRLATASDERNGSNRSRGRAPGGSETVLLVEDEDIVRRLVRDILERSGYRILEAADGQEALEVGRDNHEAIDLLLTDVVMPKMRGNELVERLLSLSPEMKILYMSGYAEDAIANDGVIEPHGAFIQKPFTVEALTQKVRTVLDAREKIA